MPSPVRRNLQNSTSPLHTHHELSTRSKQKVHPAGATSLLFTNLPGFTSPPGREVAVSQRWSRAELLAIHPVRVGLEHRLRREESLGGDASEGVSHPSALFQPRHLTDTLWEFGKEYILTPESRLILGMPRLTPRYTAHTHTNTCLLAITNSIISLEIHMTDLLS